MSTFFAVDFALQLLTLLLGSFYPQSWLKPSYAPSPSKSERDHCTSWKINSHGMGRRFHSAINKRKLIIPIEGEGEGEEESSTSTSPPPAPASPSSSSTATNGNLFDTTSSSSTIVIKKEASIIGTSLLSCY